MGHVPLLDELALIAALAVGVTLVLARLRLPTVAGLLAAGALAGPYGLGLVHSVSAIEVLAEVGVVLLLFTIGLEFSLARLGVIFGQVLVGGVLQVLLTTAAVAGVAVAVGEPAGRGVFYGFVFALSSTAIVLRALGERRELDAPHGRFIVGTLIFQDLLVVPMVLVVPLLGSAGGDNALASMGTAMLKAAAAVQLSAASRMLGPVRVVGRAYGLWREQPLSAPLLQLGGDSGLRGLPAEVLSGRNQWLGNLEVRTAPWNLHTLHVGLVLFYDVGTAWNDTPASAPVHAVGAGLRLRFPQFDTQVLRLDVGWALNGPPTALQDRFSASFGQVTDLAPGMLDAPL